MDTATVKAGRPALDVLDVLDVDAVRADQEFATDTWMWARRRAVALDTVGVLETVGSLVASNPHGHLGALA